MPLLTAFFVGDDFDNVDNGHLCDGSIDFKDPIDTYSDIHKLNNNNVIVDINNGIITYKDKHNIENHCGSDMCFIMVAFIEENIDDEYFLHPFSGLDFACSNKYNSTIDTTKMQYKYFIAIVRKAFYDRVSFLNVFLPDDIIMNITNYL